MRKSLPVTLLMILATPASAETFSQNWICVVDSAAGSFWDENTKRYMPNAINFQEEHKRFTLKIWQAVVGGALCQQTIDHWNAVIAKNEKTDGFGHLDYSPTTKTPPSLSDTSKSYDYSGNVGQNCFATTLVFWKFFDRDQASRLHGYDFEPTWFTGLPGEWLRLTGTSFMAGETLDLGPVVYTGKCEEIRVK